MKLLIDEMWDPEVAKQLRRRGYDVVGVTERRELRTMSDAQIFAAAQAERRIVVTENTRDFVHLVRRTLQGGGSHCGLILTSNRRFPRHRGDAVGRVVAALAVLLAEGRDLTNQEHRLSP